MKRIYKNKTKLRILIDTKCNLSGAVSVNICCIKPDGTNTSFTAGIKNAQSAARISALLMNFPALSFIISADMRLLFLFNAH